MKSRPRSAERRAWRPRHPSGRYPAASSRARLPLTRPKGPEYALGRYAAGLRGRRRGGSLRGQWPAIPSTMLVACPTAWDEEFRLDEAIFRRELQLVLEDGFDHAYVFGTGSEGHAVDIERFTHVARVFWDELQGITPMIGAIGLSHREHRRAAPDRLRHRLPGVPDLAAVVGAAQRRRAAALLRRHVRRVPGRPVPALQPAAHEAGAERRGLSAADRAGPQPRRDEEHGRRPRRRDRPADARARAHALHGRVELPARRDVRLGRAAGDDGAADAGALPRAVRRRDAARHRDTVPAPARVREALGRASGRRRGPASTWTARTTRCS